MLLFQLNFLQVVGNDNLVWQFFFFIEFFRHGVGSVLKIFFGFTMPSACTQTFTGVRQVNFIANESAVICWSMNMMNCIFFNVKRSFKIHIRKILSAATLIMLEKTVYLAIIFSLKQYRFYNHWSDGKQVNINVYVKCVAIIVVQENMWTGRWFIFALTFTFYVSIFYTCLTLIFLPSSRFYLVIETSVNSLKSRTQSLVMLILSGKNKFRKELACSMPSGREVIKLS